MSEGRREVSSIKPPHDSSSKNGELKLKSWIADPTGSTFGKRFTRSQNNMMTREITEEGALAGVSAENAKETTEEIDSEDCSKSSSRAASTGGDGPFTIVNNRESDDMELLELSDKSVSSSESDSSDFEEYKHQRFARSKSDKNTRNVGFQRKSHDKFGSMSGYHEKPAIRRFFDGQVPGLKIKPEMRDKLNPRDVYITAAKYPDHDWQHVPGDDNDPNTCIRTINSSNRLELVTEANIRDQGHITGMTLSNDGTMLATFSTVGVIRIWDLDTYKNIKTLRDKDESYINEFYVGKFLPDTSYLAAAGKLKDPKKWSSEDADNHILPTPIKIFDTITGDIVNSLDGHEEEVLCLETVIYKGENYLITTSQDGYIMKWSMQRGWVIEDGETCMAFNVSFLPNTGNRLFVASCDNHVALFDFETEQKIQKFGELYSCYCDYVMIVPCLELEPPKFPSLSQFLQNITINIDSELSQERLESCFAYILTRGVEEVEEIDGVPINTVPNVVCLHKLKYKTDTDGSFTLEAIRRFSHPEYRSNSWLIKLDSNGLYVAAPTYEGSVFFFNLSTGDCTAILRDHDEVEVRDVMFHPTRKLFFSCADDGTVKVYTQSVTTQKSDLSYEDEGPCCSR